MKEAVTSFPYKEGKSMPMQGLIEHLHIALAKGADTYMLEYDESSDQGTLITQKEVKKSDILQKEIDEMEEALDKAKKIRDEVLQAESQEENTRQ